MPGTTIEANRSENNILLKNIRDAHLQFTLCTQDQLSDDCLLYLILLLRNMQPQPIHLSDDKWLELLNFANNHWIQSLLYWKICSLPENLQPPKNVVDKMRSCYQLNMVNFFNMDKQLRDILTLFDQKGIDVIVLKGNAFSRSIYPEPTLRPSRDIDLLIRPTNVTQARDLLEHMGFECLEKRMEISQIGYCEEVFIPKNPNFKIVEIHWNLYPFSMVSQYVDVESLFNRSKSIEYNGLSFKTLDNIDAIIHASTHMIYNHGQKIQLNWIVDIGLLCSQLKTPQDWKELQTRSVEMGARLAVERSLIMARLWTGLTMPAGFEDFSHWPAPTNEEIANFSLSLVGSTSDKFKLLFPENIGFSQKVKLLFRLVFPSPRIIKLTDPPSQDWLLPISYVKRWYRLIKNSFKKQQLE